MHVVRTLSLEFDLYGCTHECAYVRTRNSVATRRSRVHTTELQARGAKLLPSRSCVPTPNNTECEVLIANKDVRPYVTAVLVVWVVRPLHRSFAPSYVATSFPRGLLLEARRQRGQYIVDNVERRIREMHLDGGASEPRIESPLERTNVLAKMAYACCRSQDLLG